MFHDDILISSRWGNTSKIAEQDTDGDGRLLATLGICNDDSFEQNELVVGAGEIQ